jgi:UDP-N-acetylmuramyl pentapeptide phosphotransferase/UDP-N-acetylglucosamine-1-phosphate transferase
MSSIGSLVAPAGAAVLALVLAASLTAPVRRLARRYGLTDQPAAHKAHREPIPYLGGLAIAAGTLIPVAALGSSTVDRTLAVVLGAAVAVAGLGLIDDLRRVSPRSRLAVEAVLAGAVVLAGVHLHLVSPQWLDGALTIAWIVVATNSYNLLDNSDGALATVTFATAVPLAGLCAVTGQAGLGLFVVSLGAAAVGFLLHNGPPARIFMGDSGSLFIGFGLTTATLLVGSTAGRAGHAATLGLLAFVSIVDTGLVVLSRRWHGLSIFHGGTDHAAHRLRRVGLGPYRLLGVLLLGALGPGAAAVLVATGAVPGRAALIGTVALVAMIIPLLLRVPGYPALAGIPAASPQPQPMRDSRIPSEG